MCSPVVLDVGEARFLKVGVSSAGVHGPDARAAIPPPTDRIVARVIGRRGPDGSELAGRQEPATPPPAGYAGRCRSLRFPRCGVTRSDRRCRAVAASQGGTASRRASHPPRSSGGHEPEHVSWVWWKYSRGTPPRRRMGDDVSGRRRSLIVFWWWPVRNRTAGRRFGDDAVLEWVDQAQGRERPWPGSRPVAGVTPYITRRAAVRWATPMP